MDLSRIESLKEADCVWISATSNEIARDIYNAVNHCTRENEFWHNNPDVIDIRVSKEGKRIEVLTSIYYSKRGETKKLIKERLNKLNIFKGDWDIVYENYEGGTALYNTSWVTVCLNNKEAQDSFLKLIRLYEQ